MSTSSGGGIVRVRSKTTMLMPNPDQHRQSTSQSHHYGGEMAAARSPFNHMTGFLSRQHQISVSNTHDMRRRQGLSREEDPVKRKSSRSGTRNGAKKPQQRSSSRFGSFE